MRLYLALIIIFFCSSSLFSGEGAWSTKYKLSQVGVGDDYSIYCQYSGSEGGVDYTQKEGFVFLEYTRKGQSDLQSFSPWRVTVDYYFWDNMNVKQERSLTINYEENNYIYSDYDKIALGPVDGYTIYISDVIAEKDNGNTWEVVTDLTSGSEIPVDIDLRLEIREKVIYQLDTDGQNKEVTDLFFDPSNYRLNWSYIEGAEEYDLEWVFIDRFSREYDMMMDVLGDAAQFSSGGYKMAFELKEGSRVRLNKTHFQIDKTYTQGLLFFRARAVSKFADQQSVSDDIKLGRWTYFNSSASFLAGNIYVQRLTYHEISEQEAFENRKNWSYNVAFAENGKSVSSVTFYDGSNRGRQNLTYNTSDHVTLIGESKFDYEGRQTIKVIPAPIHGRELGYRSNFNLAMDGTVFEEDNFDIDNPQTIQSPLSGESGAAQYFSENNQFTEDLFRDAIPDANGYVYSQTIYRNDGSGRIERIGGIGEEFKATGDHAVRTYYGSPTLTELKRLFGDNVSDDINGYRKEMVRDANGQYSVTYYDKRGNVIATGLSGEAPENLIELEDQNPVEVVTSLNDNNNVINPYTLKSEHTFLNGIENNPINLSYDLEGVINTIQAGTITDIDGNEFTFGELCSTCRYDLEIVVLDPSGQHLPGSPFEHEFNPISSIESCPGDPTFAGGSQVSMGLTFDEIGEYRIIKTLSVDVESMQNAFDAQLEAQGLTDAQQFINDYLRTVDVTGCYTNCEDYCIANWKLSYLFDNPTASREDADNVWDAFSDLVQKELLDNCISAECNIDEEMQETGAFTYNNADPDQLNICNSLRVSMRKQLEAGGLFFQEVLSDNPNVEVQGNPLSYYIDHPEEWTSAMAEEILYLHREFCHLATCDQWSTSLNYSMGLSLRLNNTGWSNASGIYTTPYNASVTIGGTTYPQDPFLNSVFNNVTNNLQQRVSTYMTDFIAINGPIPGSSGGTSLIDYANSFVDWLVDVQMTDLTAIGVTRDQLKVLTYKGAYDQIKEELVAKYKAEQDCEYFHDGDEVFKGDLHPASAAYEVDQMLDVMNNSILPCEYRAYQNTIEWLEGISTECLIALGLKEWVTYYPISENKEEAKTALVFTFDLEELGNNYDNGGPNNTLAEMLYAYFMETCQDNVYGHFYDPGSSPGGVEYDAIMTYLAGVTNVECDFTDELTQESCPPVENISINQEFTSTFEQDVNIVTESQIKIATQYLIDYGFDEVNNVAESPTSTPFVKKYEIFETNVPLPHGLIGDITIRKYRRPFSPIPWELLDFNFEIRNVGTTNGSEQLLCEFSGEMDPTFPSVVGISEIVGADLNQNWSGTLLGGVFNITNGVSYEHANGIWDTPGGFEIYEPTCVAIPPIVETYEINGTFPGTSWPCDAELNYDPTQDCIDAKLAQAEIDAQLYHDKFINKLRNKFLASLDKCLEKAKEDFSMSYNLKEYQYTLFYYDLVNNLVQTVPPQGVDILSYFDAINHVNPDHRMETRYKYNGANALIAQYTPDGGKTKFYLDKLHRVRFSQNARQVDEFKASYSKYDELGRVFESGEMKTKVDAEIGSGTSAWYYSFAYNLNNNSSPSSDLILDYTETFYEDVYPNDGSVIGYLISDMFPNGQQNLRNAIGAIAHHQIVSTTPEKRVTTVVSYSYDPHKNVNKMVSTNYQLYGIARHKTTEYDYDLISGNVEMVHYQKGQPDAYNHKYNYDANNRLIRAFTSRNQDVWELDAKYFYYLHGPLARVELGHDNVQGIDYAYNLQGWLKGVNSSTLVRSRDLGNDSQSGGDNEFFGKDVLAFSLGYFENDYTPIELITPSNPATSLPFAVTTGVQMSEDGNGVSHGNLYNGNITHMIVSMSDELEDPMDVLGNKYRYDQLQRIKAMEVYEDPNAVITNEFGASTTSLYRAQNGESAYQTAYSFDKNGNLTDLKRNGNGVDQSGAVISLDMDDFNYNYYEESEASVLTSEPLESNRLANVQDNLPSSYDNDVKQGQGDYNYEYDASGQLTQDLHEEIEEIQWTVSGKVKRILFVPGSNKNDLQFIYNPLGMREVKMEYLNDAHSQIKYTYYSYDAQGNLMATYHRELEEAVFAEKAGGFTAFNDNVILADHHIYGSSRLGVENSNKLIFQRTFSASSPEWDLETGIDLNGDVVAMTQATASTVIQVDQTFRKVGDKNYELSNHLGNVMEVITDRKIPYIEAGNSIADYYTADVISYSDYYPYGMQMDDRKGSTDAYRYGFQGQEKDDEVKGEGNSINYKYRMHDPRIGRFFAVDPLAPKYPHNSPYAFSENRVLDGVELEGLEFAPINGGTDYKYVGYDWSSGDPVPLPNTVNNVSVGNTTYSSTAFAGEYNAETGLSSPDFESWSITTTSSNGDVVSSIGSGGLKYSKTSSASAMYGASATETVSGVAKFNGEKSRGGKTRALFSEKGLEFMNQVDAASQKLAGQVAGNRANNMTGWAQPVYPETMLLGGIAGAGGRTLLASFTLGAAYDAGVQYAASGDIGEVDWISSFSSGSMSAFTRRPLLTISTASFINGTADFTINNGLRTVFDDKSIGAGLLDIGFSFGGGFGGRAFNSYPSGWSHFGNSFVSGGTNLMNYGLKSGLGL